MKKTFLLAISNIRKAKGHTFSFLILIMLAMSMLTAGIVTYFDTSDNFERRFSALNAEDGMIAISSNAYNDDMYKAFSEDEDVKESEIRDVMIFDGSFDFSNGTQAKRIMLIKDKYDGKIGQTEITEKSDIKYEKACYLPVIMKTSGGYKLGDDFTVKNMAGDFTFKVEGFFDNIYLGSTNLPAIGFMLSDESYEWFDKQTEGQFEGKYMLARMNDRDTSTEFIGNFFTKHCTNSDSTVCTVRTYYASCKNGRTFMSRIIASIVVAFSVIVVIISLVVIRFRIINSIEDDIKNIGALKAMGYTSKNLILSYITQFGLICIGGIVLGVALAELILPIISQSLAAQSGMIGKPQLSVVLVLILSLIMLGVITLTVYMTTRRIKKLHPIVALRNGFESHNFKTNHFAFAKSHLGKNAVFGLKNAIAHKGQNIMICVIIAVVSFVCMFVYTLFYNMAVDDTAFIETISGEIPSVMVSVNNQLADDSVLDELRADSRVEKAYYSSTQTTTLYGTNIYTYVCDDYSQRNTDICYEGRNPEHDNEIALAGFVSNEKDIKIGDEVEISLGSNTEKFLVVGLTQTGNNMGYDGELTTEGIKRLENGWKHTDIYVYLDDSVDDADYVDEMTDTLGDKATAVISISAILDSQMGAYVDMASLITIIILIITCLVITMILYLVIKTMITKNKRSIGIQKALGYTTAQLVLQMALTFAPVTIIGTAIGLVCGILFTNPSFALCLKSIGIMKVNLSIMGMHFALIALGIIIYSFIIALLISLKIRKVTAYKMLTDE